MAPKFAERGYHIQKSHKPFELCNINKPNINEAHNIEYGKENGESLWEPAPKGRSV